MLCDLSVFFSANVAALTKRLIFALIFVNESLLMLDLQDTTLALDFRVTALEENGGSDGNSSVAELEVRVETLEGTTADHETRISAAEIDINGKSFLKN